MLMFNSEKLAREVKMKVKRSWFKKAERRRSIDVWLSTVCTAPEDDDVGVSSDHRMLTP